MFELKQGDAANTGLPSKSVKHTIGSPPYLKRRGYGIGAERGCIDWVQWMLAVTKEACRVTDGLVIWVCAGATEDWCYQPGPEGLLYEWFKQGGQCWRPCYWYRVGIPGSGGKQWFRADVEYCLCFKDGHGPIEYADNTACGHVPKWAPGGEMSNRLSNGTRVNQWGHPVDSGATTTNGDFTRSKGTRPSHRAITHREANGERREDKVYNEPSLANPGTLLQVGYKSHTKRMENGEMREQTYVVPSLANPGTELEMGYDESNEWDIETVNLMHSSLLKIPVGGGIMGHPLSHENEAPYPIGVPSFFIKSFTRDGDTVLDPFCGSGTTLHAAECLGRNSIGIDIRESQIKLARERLMNPNMKKAPSKGKSEETGLFGSAT